MTGFSFRSKSEAALFVDPVSLQYLTGVRFTAGTAVIGTSFKSLFVDGRYLFKARRILGRRWDVQKAPLGPEKLFGAIHARGIRRLCVDPSSITASHYQKLFKSSNGIEIVDADGLADRIRMVKRPAELAVIREAVRITDELWSRVRSHVRIGMTEKELLAFIKQEAHRMGAEEMSFEPIVASGAGTAEPHAEAGDKKIAGDEPLMVDMGIRLGGYCSDFTRTPFLLRRRSAPPAWFTKFRDEVFAIQNLAYRELARGGRDPKFISKKISARLEKNGLKKYYLHTLGHGVGLKIHEEPYMSERGPQLKDGVVFTVEPGLYKAGFGGVRIEDMACLIRGRLEVLTKSSKELSWRM